mmetsp:Transcript_24852/g.48166  ORF Transcript_24852/g.48166 Transcript_24852/m.48166 type:complete len:278 (-) Transcript_24852:232-1065(-)
MSSDDGTPEAAAVVPSKNTGTTPEEVVEGTKKFMNIAKSFIFVEISSLVLMFSSIAAWQDKNSPFFSWVAYSLSVSVISLAACLFIQIGEFAKPGMLEKVEKPMSLFLFLWWGVGTGIITFKAPFTITSNGWFSAWAGFIFTTHWALHIDSAQFTQMEKGRQLLVLLFACSAVLIFACIGPIAQDGGYKGQAAWGISAGSITLLMCVGLIKKYDDIAINIMKASCAFFFVVWAAVAGVCTFDGPFRFTGNGYFACWGGLVVSVLSGLHQMSREDEIV